MKPIQKKKNANQLWPNFPTAPGIEPLKSIGG